METNVILKGDCIDLMQDIPDNSIDVILTDPPYLYLKNQKLEREFNEQLYFSEVKRVLKKDGFIILFGRGPSFYRWNTILADLEFNFKEEIIWDKSYVTSPMMSVSRVHETVSIFCKGKGKIRKCKIPYLEMKRHNLDSIITDIKRLKAAFNNPKVMDNILQFIEFNRLNDVPVRNDRYDNPKFTKHHVNTDIRKSGDRTIDTLQSISFGMNEKTIIRPDRGDDYIRMKNHTACQTKKANCRAVDTFQSVSFGLNEKTIIRSDTIIAEKREHYKTIHPTQKPVRLMERLLNLVVEPNTGATVLDTFIGSGSTIKACINLGHNYIGMEIDDEYYNNTIKSIEEYKRNFEPKLKLA